ncbi:MAG: response regulator [Alphaproteobacteria bacterium]|nr:response regulator [Alphaproteobacteria bacterium]
MVVDDDPKVRLLLRRCLETENYQVLEADCEAAVHRCLDENTVDLITLDLNLGVESGLTIAAGLRANSDIPIIIVTGKGDVIDKVVGLEMGADDYISKPFHVREVLARIRSVLRRSDTRSDPPCEPASPETGPNSDTVFRFGDWIADPNKFELTRVGSNSPQDLTTADFRLLTVFLENPRRVLSRDQIMDRLSGQEWTPYDRAIDNQVARLRKKIEPDPTNPTIIKTVRGIGYTLVAEVTAIEAD